MTAIVFKMSKIIELLALALLIKFSPILNIFKTAIIWNKYNFKKNS